MERGPGGEVEDKSIAQQNKGGPVMAFTNRKMIY